MSCKEVIVLTYFMPQTQLPHEPQPSEILDCKELREQETLGSGVCGSVRLLHEIMHDKGDPAYIMNIIPD